MINVKNKRVYDGDGVYVGRPSVYGNPYPLENERDRLLVLDQYKAYLDRQLVRKRGFYRKFMQLVETYNQTGDLTLICWCDPKPCHAHVLAEYIQRYSDGNVAQLEQ